MKRFFALVLASVLVMPMVAPFCVESEAFGAASSSQGASASANTQGLGYDELVDHLNPLTFDREDYESDEAYANFRNIVMGDIVEGLLYRSSSPVNNELHRAAYADDLMQQAGIQTVIDLADSQEEIEGYMSQPDFDSPYYQSLYDSGNVIALNLEHDTTAPEFRHGLARGLRFLIRNDGPYLIHCNMGRDRAGFVSALLECLMGATYDEIADDYMTTFVNYYHADRENEYYLALRDSRVSHILSDITGESRDTDMGQVDLAGAAEEYLVSIGLSQDEVSALKDRLSGGDGSISGDGSSADDNETVEDRLMAGIVDFFSDLIQRIASLF